MTAQTRTAKRAPGVAFQVAERTSTSRLVVIGAAIVLELVTVLGFVSSNLGLGYPPYPNPDPVLGPTPPPSVAPGPAAALEPSRASAAKPAPDPAPAPR